MGTMTSILISLFRSDRWVECPLNHEHTHTPDPSGFGCCAWRSAAAVPDMVLHSTRSAELGPL